MAMLMPTRSGARGVGAANFGDAFSGSSLGSVWHHIAAQKAMMPVTPNKYYVERDLDSYLALRHALI